MIRAELNYDTSLKFYGDEKIVDLLNELEQKVNNIQYEVTKRKIKYLKYLLSRNNGKIDELKKELKKFNNNLICRILDKTINENVKIIKQEINKLENFNEDCIVPQIYRLETKSFTKSLEIMNILTVLGFSYKGSNKNQGFYEFVGDDEQLTQKVNQEIEKIESKKQKNIAEVESKIQRLYLIDNDANNLTSDDIYSL